MNFNTSQAQLALADVQARKWIVANLSDTGAFSVSPSPVRHDTAASAERECERLAKLNPGTAYTSLQFRAGRLVPKVTNILSL